MTPEERALLMECALAIGAISDALSQGFGIKDLELMHGAIMRNVGAKCQALFSKELAQLRDQVTT